MKTSVKTPFWHIAHYVAPSLYLNVKYLRQIGAIALAIVFISLPKSGFADLALIMFTSDHCPYCMAWEREVGTIYDKSAYAKNLPLRRFQFGSSLPDSIKISTPILGTPTFIILKDGTEKGRITGYSGAEMFWWQLSEFTTATP